MHPLVNIALRAARDAAEAIAHSSDRLDRVKILNQDPDNFLTSMDEAADKTVCYHIENAHPEHSIDSRVSGYKQGENKDVVWLVEPLLGNKNFARGYTQFGVSIACQVDGVLKHAVLVCPLLHEEYTASRGVGAQLNSRRLRVGKNTELSDGFIGLNAENINPEEFIALQGKMLAAGMSPRMSGCTAIDIVQTAADRLQGGWAANIDSQALAGASLILQEAGGLLGSETGNPDVSKSKELIFANPKLFKALLKLRNQ